MRIYTYNRIYDILKTPSLVFVKIKSQSGSCSYSVKTKVKMERCIKCAMRFNEILLLLYKVRVCMLCVEHGQYLV